MNAFLYDICDSIIVFFLFKDFEVIDEALKESLLFHTSNLG